MISNQNNINILIPVNKEGEPVDKYSTTSGLTSLVPPLVVIFNKIHDIKIRSTLLNTFISNDKIMNVPLSNNKALLSYFKIIKKFNVKPKADFLDFLVTREYISEFTDNNPTKESEVALGILDSYIENTDGQVMANGGGVKNKKLQNIKNRLFAKHKK